MGILIAAVCIADRETLVTDDPDFGRIRELRVGDRASLR